MNTSEDTNPILSSLLTHSEPFETSLFKSFCLNSFFKIAWATFFKRSCLAGRLLITSLVRLSFALNNNSFFFEVNEFFFILLGTTDIMVWPIGC